MEFITYFLSEYFSDPHNVTFWGLVAVALLTEELIKRRRNRKMMEIWLKEHQTAGKKRRTVTVKKNKVKQFPADKKYGYINAAWEEIEK